MNRKSKANNIIMRVCAVVLIAACLFNVVACTTHRNDCGFGEWEIVKPATCEEEGLRVRTCNGCGATEEEKISKIDHNYIVDKGYPATCTSAGLTDGAHCSVCGEVLIEQSVIPPTAHVLEDIDGLEPTFTETGLTAGKKCSVCGEIIVEQCEIERLKEEDFGYKVDIGTDEHVAVYIYLTQDYDVEPILTNVAYARSSDNGELTKNGSGQVNFELRFDEGYYLKDILLTSGYNALKTPDDTGKENIYRITKITNELVMFVSSQKQVGLEDFASVTDDNGIVNFSWARDPRIDRIEIKATYEDDILEYELDGRQSSWSCVLDQDKYYSFEFVPYDETGEAGEIYTCTRYYNPQVKEIGFPRVEINTLDGIFPSCDYVEPPENCIGFDITNNNYVQCIVNIFDKDNKSVYTSSDDSDYSSAKVKIRGNSSADTEKAPYKIKLSKKADLLSTFVAGRTDKEYADKEWVLLKSGYYIRQIVGTSIAETVQMEYVPNYTYCALYLNGDYRGLYILTEAVNQGNGTDEEQSRCAVGDDGYIVELDAYWWSEDIWFTSLLTAYHMRYTFKYPDPDDLTMDSPKIEYIKNYIMQAEATLLNGDAAYCDYMDVESFAKWILGHDLLASYDAGGTNMYVLKKDDTDESKLYMAVLWDFDSICDWRYVDNLAEIRTKPYFFFSTLEKDDIFIEKYNALYNNVRTHVLNNLENKLNEMDSDNYDRLIAVERVRWSNVEYNNYDVQKSDVLSWFDSHLSWMDEYFSEI